MTKPRVHSCLIPLPESKDYAVNRFYLTLPPGLDIVGKVNVQWQYRLFDKGKDAVVWAFVKRL